MINIYIYIYILYVYTYMDLNNGGMAIVHRFVQNKDLTNSGHVNKLSYDGTLTHLTTLWGYTGVRYGVI